MKRKVLFLCTGNSCRSQIAEALVNARMGDAWEAFSAGIHPAGYVHPRAIAALKEIGIDISIARSKSAGEFRNVPFDLVVTVCDELLSTGERISGPAIRKRVEALGLKAANTN